MLLAAMLAGPAAVAFETDQYLAWTSELEDSSGRLNTFLNEQTELLLGRINRRQPQRLSCEELPPKIYRRLFRSILGSRVRSFVTHDPHIDRLPDDEVGYWSYLGDSIYRGSWFPFVLPMSRTIRIGEVYLGTDKLGHLFGHLGRGYYRQYRRGLASGLPDEEAMRKAILWGVRRERTLVGGFADGVFSYADLEANFQGLRLARDLCEREPPHLVFEDGGWRLAHPIDLRDYVNPRFDESFYTSHYLTTRWTTVRSVLMREYCPLLDSDLLRKRFEHYRSGEQPSFSTRVIADYFEQRGADLQSRQALTNLCPGQSASEVPHDARQAGTAGGGALTGRAHWR